MGSPMTSGSSTDCRLKVFAGHVLCAMTVGRQDEWPRRTTLIASEKMSSNDTVMPVA